MMIPACVVVGVAVFLVSTQNAAGLKAAGLRDQSSRAVNVLFHKRPNNPLPSSDYILFMSISKGLLRRDKINAEKYCKRARTGMYTNFPETRNASVTYDEFLKEVETKDSYFMSRYARRKTYQGASSQTCFAAMRYDGDIIDTQQLLAVWMNWWWVRWWYSIVIYAPNGHCEYPDDDDTDPSFCSKIPTDIFKGRWNRFGRDLAKETLYIQDMNDTHFVIYDMERDDKWPQPWTNDDSLNTLMNTFVRGSSSGDQCVGQITCENEGTAYHDGTRCKCKCKDGYEGDYCEIVADPCASVKCQNDGKPKQSGKECSCQCTSDWKGDDCGTAVCPSGYTENEAAQICFKLVTDATQEYDSAAGRCSQKGDSRYHLVVLDSSAKIDVVVEAMKKSPAFTTATKKAVVFIGHKKEGNKWVYTTNNQEVDSGPFYSGEPSNDGDCGTLIVLGQDQGFGDLPCTGKTKYYVCQFDQ